MDAEMKQYLEGMEARLREHTETTETRLLTEFWKWARTADARYRQSIGMITGADGTVNGLNERVSMVEDRVAELERGGLR